MKKVFILLTVLSSLVFATEYKVVFDLMSGDANKISKNLITNIALLKEHYKKQDDTLKVAVVISGDAYKFFVEDIAHSPYASSPNQDLINHELEPRFKQLVNQGTEFKVCAKGMASRGITEVSLYDYAVPAFNKTAALIEYQNAGYAYIPLN